MRKTKRACASLTANEPTPSESQPPTTPYLSERVHNPQGALGIHAGLHALSKRPQGYNVTLCKHDIHDRIPWTHRDPSCLQGTDGRRQLDVALWKRQGSQWKR